MDSKYIRQTNLKYIMKIFTFIGVLLLSFLLSFTFVFGFINALVNLGIIKKTAAMLFASILSFLLALTLVISHNILKNKRKNNVFKTVNLMKYYILYFLVMRLLTSIEATVEITIEDAKALLTTEWTLLIALLGLLVTWCIISEREINRNKRIDNPFGSKDRLTKITNQFNNQNLAKNYFWDIIPTAVSLFIITFITPMIFINKEINLFTQALLYSNLHIIINSMIIIILDILTPTILKLIIQKKDIINDETYYDEMTTGILEDRFFELAEKTYPEFVSLSKQAQIDIIKKLCEDNKDEINKMTENARLKIKR